MLCPVPPFPYASLHYTKAEAFTVGGGSLARHYLLQPQIPL